jgi:glycosyltransferase involved in cell wall biosynthesis
VDKVLTRLMGETTTDAHAPLVTIVIVNHNYGEFIGQCIRSVDLQDYPNIHCIVLDCASNDDSLPVIEAMLDQTERSFFQLVRREVNHGHVMNSLSVLDEVKGAFVTFLDADDFLFPEFVSTHVKAHLNDVNSAALSVTDQIQVDAAGQVLAGTCHWHQKWRAFEPGTAWTELTQARSWTSTSPYRMEPLDISRLHYIPAWWSSWLMERWIWGATSGIMFRRTVIESLAPPMEQPADLGHITMDGYFGRFAHSVGGTLVVDGAQGAYRRHGRNIWSSNQVLGGQTANGARDQAARFRSQQRMARQVLETKYRDLVQLFGHELYYSIAWQLMSNGDFHDFAQKHGEDRAIWERTIQIAGAANPAVTG